ncbi:MAG: Asp-tRNA(Asn)/Glu-tRNA(Gln) amidotransferase subunit GatA [Elusimicrobiota bacterium]
MSKFKTISQKTQDILSGKTTCLKVLEDKIDNIKGKQEKLNSFISLDLARARKRAKELDKKISKGENPGPLTGTIIGIKDNMLFKGTRTTCGSKILENYSSPYTATAVEKLADAGAVIIGKTNMDEFAMGSSGETSFFGPTLNPADTQRIPGGSSSGSAAGVASGQVTAALGSDTGGSIRQPAAMCGAVGLKPTYGLVSRYGLVAFSSSLDQIGPLTGNVTDSAVILNAIAGYDRRDSTSLDVDIPDYTEDIERGVKDLTIGIPQEYMGEGLDAQIRERVEDTAEKLEDSGATIRPVSLPLTKYGVAVYYIIAPAEASANLARFDGVKYGHRSEKGGNLISEYINTRSEGFGSEVKRRIMLGTYSLSSGYYDAYYLKAQKVRNLMKEEFEEVYRNVDFLLTPTSPTTAFKLGEKSDNPLQMYLSDVFTISCNLVGLPGMNVPAGTDSAGLPIGMQLLGPKLSEKKLLRVARRVEKFYE